MADDKAIILLRHDFGHPWPLRATAFILRCTQRRVSRRNYGTKDIIAFFALVNYDLLRGSTVSP
jgi:hypothetical protein